MILPIVVIYKTDWKSCNSYKSLFSKYDGVIMLYDNSPKDVNSIYISDRMVYVHDPLNQGVSKAYNTGAEWALAHGYTHVALFDEDTKFSADYIEILSKAITTNKEINVFVPTLLYNGDKIFSPSEISRWRIKAKRLPAGQYSLNNFMPVNSGVCLKIESMLSVGGYNEKIPLDFSDYDFFTRLRKKTGCFYLVNAIGNQNFSNNERDKGKLLNRYTYYLKGAKEFCNPNAIHLLVLRHTVALTLRTMSLDFIRLYLKYRKEAMK